MHAIRCASSSPAAPQPVLIVCFPFCCVFPVAVRGAAGDSCRLARRPRLPAVVVRAAMALLAIVLGVMRMPRQVMQFAARAFVAGAVNVAMATRA
jgi:hypothetical protein